MKWVSLFIIGFLRISCFAQNGHEIIRVSNDIDLIRLSENAYVHVSRHDMPGYGVVSSNGLIFIAGDKEAFLFDTPVTDSQTKDLVTWLEDNLGVSITGFIPNHWHDDCLGGLRYLQSRGIKSYANQITIDSAKTKNLPVPEYGFADSLELKLGDKIIDCYYMGAAHSTDNIVVWIPSEQILFAGCMLKSMDSKNLGNTADGDIDAYPVTIEKLKAKFPVAKVVIPGHGQFGGLELIEHTRTLIFNSDYWIENQIRSYIDSTEIMLNNGRKMLQETISNNDFSNVNEIYRYLEDITRNKNYSAFNYNEDLLLNMLMGDWSATTRLMSDYYEEIDCCTPQHSSIRIIAI